MWPSLSLVVVFAFSLFIYVNRTILIFQYLLIYLKTFSYYLFQIVIIENFFSLLCSAFILGVTFKIAYTWIIFLIQSVYFCPWTVQTSWFYIVLMINIFWFISLANYFVICICPASLSYLFEMISVICFPCIPLYFSTHLEVIHIFPSVKG